MTAYTRTYDHLWLISLDAEQHARTCNYWYLVQAFGGTPHKAFTHKASLMQWLQERGLAVSRDIPNPGQHSVHQILGRYREAMHMPRDTFDAIEGKPAIVLSNAEYTTAKLARDADGVMTVHYLNCNVPDREVHHYQATRERIG